MTYGHGIAVGVAQVLALVPGVSRSGATTTAALSLGYTRPAAARFSFLLAVPAVFGSGLFELVQSFSEPGPYSLGETLAATVVAFVVGFVVIAFFMNYISRRSFLPFVVYRLVLGVVLLVLLGDGRGGRVRSWSRPAVPTLPGTGPSRRSTTRRPPRCVRPAPSTGPPRSTSAASRPYDATHLGHAATYLAFDTLVRAWLDAGVRVTYAQNTTDVDDPLLERATATGVDWRELAASQTDLFRSDMEHLAVLPPDHYVAVTDVVPEVAEAVAHLVDRGVAYRVPTSSSSDGDDVYFDVARGRARHELAPRPREPLRRGDDGPLLRRARGRPRARGQTRPARPAALARRPRRRALLDLGARRRTSRLAHRVHRHRASSTWRRRSPSTAAGSTSSSRTTR